MSTLENYKLFYERVPVKRRTMRVTYKRPVRKNKTPKSVLANQ